jgi:hypothetical protein
MTPMNLVKEIMNHSMISPSYPCIPKNDLARIMFGFFRLYKYNRDSLSPILHHLINKFDQIHPLGISFSDFHHSIDADLSISLRDKHVLEVGGALSPEWVFDILGVKSWQAVEHHLYEDQVGKTYADLVDYKANNGEPCADFINYSYYNLGISDFSKGALASGNKYDCAYSVACFEHLSNLAEALADVYVLLESGALFYSYYSPIWSAPQELHCPLPDAMIVPDYFHLTHTSEEARAYLLNSYGDSIPLDDIENYLDMLYALPHINRLMPSDYLKAFEESDFVIRDFQFILPRSLSELDFNTSSRIIRNYPGTTVLASGIRLILQKN